VRRDRLPNQEPLDLREQAFMRQIASNGRRG
jgi:hypothetical protein